jgi:WD40 repeat protein
LGYLLKRILAEFCLKSGVFYLRKPAGNVSGGPPEAKELVKRLAGGNLAAQWTRMAQAAHARLSDRPSPPSMPAKKVDAFGDPLPDCALARLGTIRMQSGNSSTITPDGKTLVTVSDKSLHAWDMKTGGALPGFPQTKDWADCRAVAISPDGKLLAVAYDRAYSFDICEFPGGKLLHQHRGKGEASEPCRYTVAFSSDSKNFVIASQANTQIWDMTTGKKLREFAHARFQDTSTA